MNFQSVTSISFVVGNRMNEVNCMGLTASPTVQKSPVSRSTGADAGTIKTEVFVIVIILLTELHCPSGQVNLASGALCTPAANHKLTNVQTY
jgi:hypothetical protein